jgi:hypothetical protein
LGNEVTRSAETIAAGPPLAAAADHFLALSPSGALEVDRIRSACAARWPRAEGRQLEDRRVRTGGGEFEESIEDLISQAQDNPIYGTFHKFERDDA